MLHQTDFNSSSSSSRSSSTSHSSSSTSNSDTADLPYGFALTELLQYECRVALNVSSACPLCAISVVLNHTQTFFGHTKTLQDGQAQVHVAGKVPGGGYVLTIHVETVRKNADVLGCFVAANGCTELSADGQVLDYDMFRTRADGRPVRKAGK